MRTTSWFLAFGLCLLLLSSHTASAQVIVRGHVGAYGPPRGYYGVPRGYHGPRYYRPRPAVVYAVPPPAVVMVPAPYCAPRPLHYAPRPSYGPRHHGRGRRW